MVIIIISLDFVRRTKRRLLNSMTTTNNESNRKNKNRNMMICGWDGYYIFICIYMRVYIWERMTRKLERERLILSLYVGRYIRIYVCSNFKLSEESRNYSLSNSSSCRHRRLAAMNELFVYHSLIDDDLSRF